MSDPGFYWFEGDYLRDTSHLLDLEDLAYRRLLGAYYSRQQPLPDDIIRLCQIARLPEAAVRPVVDEFFPRADDGLRHNKRADRVITERATFRAAQSEKGKKSAAARAKMFNPGSTPVQPRFNPGSTAVPTGGATESQPPFPFPFPLPSTEKKRKDPVPQKARHLRFVFLTAEEENKLRQKLNGAYQEMLDRLDGYIGQIGERKAASRYKSHYDTILNWWRKDEKERPASHDGPCN